MYLCGARSIVMTSFCVGSGIGPETFCSGAFGSIHDLHSRLVNKVVVIRLKLDPDLLTAHSFLLTPASGPLHFKRDIHSAVCVVFFIRGIF